MARAKRSSEKISSVIDETVPANVWEDIVANKPFISVKGSHYVCLVNVNNFGGLSKREANDESKGQFLQRIRGGSVHVYFDDKFDNMDSFIIIPDGETLTNLSEFTFLSTFKKYRLTKANFTDGIIQFTPLNRNLTYDELCDIQFNGVKLEDIVGSKNSSSSTAVQNAQSNAEPQNNRRQTAEPYMPAEMDITSQTDTDIPSGQLDFNTVDYIMCPACGSVTFNPETNTCDICGFVAEPVEEQSNYIEDINTEGGDSYEVSDEELTEIYERHLYPDDIDLVVTFAPFESKFERGNKFIPIAAQSDSSWLDQYTNQFVNTVNSQLENLHANNLLKIRDMYYQLMIDSAQQIYDKVSYDNPTNQYSKQRQAEYEKAQGKKKSLELSIEQRRDEINRAWDETLQQVGESAAATAKQNYINDHRDAHEAQLRDVEKDFADQIDIEYSEAINNINDLRRTAARQMFENAITQALITIDGEYRRMLDDEQDVRNENIRKIQDYIDKHRKEDIARADIMAEELRQKSESERVADQYEEQIEKLTKNYDAICDKLRQDIANSKQHEEMLIQQNNEKVKNLKEQIDEYRNKYQALEDKYTNLDMIKSAEYDERIQTVINDKNAALSHLSHVDAVHRKNNILSIVVWFAVVIAMFILGIFFGNAKNIFGSKNAEPVQQVPTTYNLQVSPEVFSGTGQSNTNTQDNMDINQQLTQYTNENGTIVMEDPNAVPVMPAPEVTNDIVVENNSANVDDSGSSETITDETSISDESGTVDSQSDNVENEG